MSGKSNEMQHLRQVISFRGKVKRPAKSMLQSSICKKRRGWTKILISLSKEKSKFKVLELKTTSCCKLVDKGTKEKKNKLKVIVFLILEEKQYTATLSRTQESNVEKKGWETKVPDNEFG